MNEIWNYLLRYGSFTIREIEDYLMVSDGEKKAFKNAMRKLQETGKITSRLLLADTRMRQYLILEENEHVKS